MTVTVCYWTWWFSSWIYPARNWCKRLPEGKPPLSYNCPMVFPSKPPFSYGFPMVFLWFSHENLHFPMAFLWFSYGFPMKTSIFLWFSFSHENLHFPMVFLWFSYGFPEYAYLLSIGPSRHPIPWSKISKVPRRRAARRTPAPHLCWGENAIGRPGERPAKCLGLMRKIIGVYIYILYIYTIYIYYLYIYTIYI